VRVTTLLLLIVAVLTVFGLVMLASASGVKAIELYGDPMFFVYRQLLWLALALLVAGVISRIDYRRWRYLAVPVFILSVILLVLVLIPGIGTKVGGSRRWLRFGVMQIQPSEFAKFSLVIVLAWWMARERMRSREFGRGVLAPMTMLGLIAGLIFLEPDYGTTMLCGLVGMAIMFAGGALLRYLVLFAGSGLTLFCIAVMHNEVRRGRVLAFLAPEKYAQTYSFQLINAINAFVAGGWRGVGLGASVQKHFYLPEAHTDFIFAIIGEELGMLGTLGVVLLFAGICACGMRISIKAPDWFGRLLAFGLTILITMQAMFNIGVVTGCLPTKGLTLPFISFGGSSLMMSLAAIAVLLNIAWQSSAENIHSPLRKAAPDVEAGY
jgi:cell division protein FtsW